ncbi:CDP-diacylglycerol--serine O-phosphatidyltransferase [soil metagenome]
MIRRHTRSRGGPAIRTRRRLLVRADGRARIPRSAVPSAFTLANLLSGFLSLIRAAQGDFETAAWLIVLAGFFDLLDGMVARLTRGDSEFGVELDSLADIVSFGVAPSFLIYHFGAAVVPFWAFFAALPALCGAVRLARFNTSHIGEKQDYFVGLPIPAAAGMIVAFILAFSDNTWFDGLERGNISILIPLVVIVSMLMVSPVRFPALPQPNRASLRKYPRRFLGFGIGLLLVLFLSGPGLLIAAVGYVLVGLFNAGQWVVSVIREPDEDEPSVNVDPPPQL